MNDPQRDIQFLGFAKALWEELCDLSERSENHARLRWEDAIDIFARRAYDLVEHACWEIGDLRGVELCADQMLEAVSDLPDLPEVEP